MGSVKKIKLLVIPKPEEGTRAVIVFKKPEGKIKGKGIGDTSLLCGQCDVAIAQNIADEMIKNIVICCGSCGAYNEIPMDWNRFRFVEIKEQLQWPLFFFGIVLIIAPEVMPKAILGYENISRWIGIGLLIIGSIVSNYLTRLVHYFKDSGE